MLVDDGLEGLDERARRSRGRRSSAAGAAGAVARRRRGSCAHGTGERPRLAAGGVERERGRLISRSSSSQSLSWSSSSPPSAEMSTIAAQFATKGKKVRAPSSRSRRLPRPPPFLPPSSAPAHTNPDLAPSLAVRRHWPQLRRTHQGAQQRHPDRALLLPQAHQLVRPQPRQQGRDPARRRRPPRRSVLLSPCVPSHPPLTLCACAPLQSNSASSSARAAATSRPQRRSTTSLAMCALLPLPDSLDRLQADSGCPCVRTLAGLYAPHIVQELT